MQYYSLKKIKVKEGELDVWKRILGQTIPYIKDNQELKTNIKWCIEQINDYL